MVYSSDDPINAEKQEHTSTTNDSTYLSDNTTPKWQLSEEKKLVRKVDMTVLPLLFLGLLVFQFDRMNLASALTGGFRRDIAIDQSTVNLGNQMMYLGTVVLEIPSSLILQRLGPRR